MKKSIILAAVVALFAGSASASDYAAPVTYKTVTVYVTKLVPFTVHVTKYDSYGHAYTATVTKYKTVEVPVTKRVPVYH